MRKCVVILAAFCGLSGGQMAGEKAVVSGVVVDGATGGPLDRAMVELVGAQSRVSSRMMTGPDGRFSFETLRQPAVLQAWRKGYRSSTSESEVEMRHLDQGRSPEPLTLKLVPLAVATGRVVDQHGEPLMGLTVQLLTSTVRDGKRNVREYSTNSTNDLGEFRMWHVAPGDYYLKILGRRGISIGMGEMPATGHSAEAYGPVYFPAAATQGEAELIRLAPGETKQADFQVVGHVAYRVRGVLKNYTPYEQASFELKRGRDAVGNRVKLDMATGAFEIEDVAPGSYTLHARAAAGKPLAARAEITVGSGDVRGVQLALMGVEVRGTVRWSGESSTPVSISLTRIDEGGMPEDDERGARVNEQNPNFSIQSLMPGRYQVEVRPSSLSGWYASSVRSGNRDVIEEGWIVTEAGSEPLEVVMSRGGGRLQIKLKGGEDAEELEFAAVRRLGPFRDVYRESVPPSIGERSITLPPGDYRVYAWRAGEPLEYCNPAVLDALESQAVRISLADGAMEKIEVPVIKRARVQ